MKIFKTPIIFNRFLYKLSSTTRSHKVIEFLASEKNFTYVSTLANNPNTSLKALEMLSRDGDWFVRYCVAENPNVALDILKRLINDEDLNVKKSALFKLNKIKKDLK